MVGDTIEGVLPATRMSPESTREAMVELAGTSSDMVQRVIDLAQRHLGMDVTYISRFVDGRQTYRAFTGDNLSFGIGVGDGPALPGTYCSRMVVGEIPNMIPDTDADLRVRYLPITRRAAIGSYIGVPLRLTDGTLYGSFCCLSHDPTKDLTERDVNYLRLLADLLVDELDGENDLEKTRTLVNDVLDRGGISIALQPVVDVATRRRLGVEALARFPAEFGTPESLFRAAHDVGLSVELEQFTASKALHLAPLLAPDEFLSINMSPASIIAWESLVDGFRSLAANRLVLEVTEHQAIDEYAEVRRSVESLRRRGIRLAIDDVGAGYASLHHVLQLEPDFVKIDRKLVDGAATDPARRSVIRGFVALAADIGATVIGEGVERQEDFDVLLDLGVDAAQGYLLGRPVITAPPPDADSNPQVLPLPRRA